MISGRSMKLYGIFLSQQASLEDNKATYEENFEIIVNLRKISHIPGFRISDLRKLSRAPSCEPRPNFKT